MITVWFEIFFLVVCRSRKRYALYLILLPKFHPIATTLKLLTLGAPPPQGYFPNQTLSHRLLFKNLFFYGVPCALCTNFFAGRGRLDKLDMFVEVPFLCLCCCRCIEAKRSPSPLSTSSLIFSTSVPLPVLCSLLSPLWVPFQCCSVALLCVRLVFIPHSLFLFTITRAVLHGSSWLRISEIWFTPTLGRWVDKNE